MQKRACGWLPTGLMGIVMSAWPVAASTLPAAVELHHYNAESVTLYNNGGTDQSADIDTIHLLFKTLQWPLQVQQVPLARTDHMMAQGKAVCSLNRVKNTDRASRFLFSRPLNVYLGYQLYQHGQAPAVPNGLLNSDGQIQALKALMHHFNRQQIVVPKSYSFGDQLDAAIADLPPRQITAIATEDYYQHFVAMFEAGRADFILLYPTEMQGYLQQNPGLKVRRYALAQAPAYLTGHLMCADTPATRQFIQQVDQALLQLYRQDDFIDANSYKLSAVDAQQIRQIIQTLAVKAAKQEQQ